MGTWSSIRDFYRRWKPEVQIYGLGFLLLVSALMVGKLGAAIVVFVLMCIADAMRRWGEPYRQHGKMLYDQRQVQHQREIAENVAWFFARFQRKAPPSVTVPGPAPSQEEDNAPESPPLVNLDEQAPAKPSSAAPTVAVTHET